MKRAMSGAGRRPWTARPLEIHPNWFNQHIPQWPNWYMYMENNKEGSVRGWNGDPGPQGHWKVTYRGTVTIGEEAVPKYVFCPD